MKVFLNAQVSMNSAKWTLLLLNENKLNAFIVNTVKIFSKSENIYF